MSFGAKYTNGYVERSPVLKNYTFHYFFEVYKLILSLCWFEVASWIHSMKMTNFLFFLLFTTETMVILYFFFFSWHAAHSVFSLSLYGTNTHPPLFFANIPAWTFERNLSLRHMKQKFGLHISGRKKTLVVSNYKQKKNGCTRVCIAPCWYCKL